MAATSCLLPTAGCCSRILWFERVRHFIRLTIDVSGCFQALSSVSWLSNYKTCRPAGCSPTAVSQEAEEAEETPVNAEMLEGKDGEPKTVG